MGRDVRRRPDQPHAGDARLDREIAPRRGEGGLPRCEGKPPGDGLLPDELAGSAVKALGMELVVNVGRDKQMLRGEYRRGLSPANVRFPNHILAGAEFGGEAGVVRNPGAVGPSKARPVLRVTHIRRNQQCEGQDETKSHN